MFLALISTVCSQNPQWKNLGEVGVYAIFCVLVSEGIIISDMQAKRVLQTLLFVMLFLAMCGCYNFIVGNSGCFQFTRLSLDNSFYSIFGSRNVDIHLILTGFIVASALLINLKQWKLGLVCLAVFGFSIIISLSRSVLITAIIIPTLLIVVSNRLVGKKIDKKGRVFSFVVSGILVVTLGSMFYEDMVGRFVDRWMLAGESGRIYLAAESLGLMVAHPVIGIGFGNYRHFTRDVSK